MSVEQNMELMQTLDDAWNNQDWETFNQRHADEIIEEKLFYDQVGLMKQIGVM